MILYFFLSNKTDLIKPDPFSLSLPRWLFEVLLLALKEEKALAIL